MNQGDISNSSIVLKEVIDGRISSPSKSTSSLPKCFKTSWNSYLMTPVVRVWSSPNCKKHIIWGYWEQYQTLKISCLKLSHGKKFSASRFLSSHSTSSSLHAIWPILHIKKQGHIYNPESYITKSQYLELQLTHFLYEYISPNKLMIATIKQFMLKLL